MRSPINSNDRDTMNTQPSAKSTRLVLLALGCVLIVSRSLRLIGDLMQPINQQINVGFNPTVFSLCPRDVARLNDIIQSLAVAASQQARRGVSG